MPEFNVGDVFVGHRIEGLAGRGGMGVVYRATDVELERLVALKVITPALAEEEDFRRRFVAESKAAASIEHPNVIPVYYAGEREGVLFIVMRYIDGPDLRALVRAQGQLDPERAAHIVAQVGAALDAAHAHGLVHRDVKPANVLLGEEDHAYLTDFGLTKRTATTGDHGASRAGGWVGTLGYVAPEQIRGGRIDARTDVYALGCVLAYALTGNAPFMRESDEATLWAHLNSPPPSEEVPPEFEGVIARALAKDPSDRYPSAGDLGRAALAAAGRSAATRPERNVARGAAAPPGLTSPTAATARISSPDSETRPSPADATVVTARDGEAGRGGAALAAVRGRPKVLAGLGALLVAAVLAIVLLGGGGDDGGAGGSAGTTTTAPPVVRAPSSVGKPIDVGVRPNALTVAGGRVWALSVRPGELDVVDPQTDERRAIPIGDGGMSLTGGFDSLWILKGGRTRTLQRRSVKTGRLIGTPTEIAYPGSPVSIVADHHALWVALRVRRATSGAESVVKIDPSSLQQQLIAIPGGVQDIAVGAGALWVTNRFRDAVVRVDANTGAQRTIAMTGAPQGIAVGEGAVWVATRGDDTITRISPSGTLATPIATPSIPARVTTGGGSVWATATDAGRLLRIDPAKRTVDEERIFTGARPFALDVEHGEAVWVTLLTAGAVQRVSFFR
jgi:streptogramin lyase/predicted Ser/Thr protein kinase